VAAALEVEMVADPPGDRVGQPAGQGVLVDRRERALVAVLQLPQEAGELIAVPAVPLQGTGIVSKADLERAARGTVAAR